MMWPYAPAPIARADRPGPIAHPTHVRQRPPFDSRRAVESRAPRQVVMRPGFGEWLAKSVAAPAPHADFINLAAVRPWGVRRGGVAVQLDARSVWPPWNGGALRPSGELRAPNIMVSAYLARSRSLPLLLASYMRVQGWQHPCAIDQVRPAAALRASSRTMVGVALSARCLALPHQPAAHRCLGASSMRSMVHGGTRRWRSSKVIPSSATAPCPPRR